MPPWGLALVVYVCAMPLVLELAGDVARKSMAGWWPRWLYVTVVVAWPLVMVGGLVALVLGLVLHAWEAARSALR